MKAVWNGNVIAESNDIVIIEDNSYFPESSVNKAFLKESTTITRCPWKGFARYYTLEVNGKENPDAAWYYPEPSDLARDIKGRIAFWKGVQIIQDKS